MNTIKILVLICISLQFVACGGDDDKTDTTPKDFTFTDKVDVGLDTLVESAAIVVDEINEEAEISIVGGEYSVDGAGYTDEDGLVVDGQTVKVRVRSSELLDTSTSTTLTIGGVSDTFTVTTESLNLSVIDGFKTIVFSWPKVAGVTGYRLMYRTDSDDEYVIYGSDYDSSVTTAKIDVSVHTFDWWNAEFLLEACIYDVCSSTSSKEVINTRTGAVGYLKAPNTNAYDKYGIVAISADGNTVAIGAPGEDSSSMTNGDIGNNSLDGAGAVYIYNRVNKVWAFQCYLKAPNSDEGDAFGSAISLSSDGKVIVVGAPGEDSQFGGLDGNQYDNSAKDAGAAYVYRRAGDTWLLQNYLKASNPDPADLFGSSVSISSFGSYIAIGAPGEAAATTDINGDESSNTASGAGASYLYSLLNDAWQQEAYIKAPNAEAMDQFGRVLQLNVNGTVLVVGAPHEASSANTINGNMADNSYALAGAAYVFEKSEGLWSFSSYLKAPNNSESFLFGSAVAISAQAGVIAVGSPGEASSSIGVNGDMTDKNSPSSGAAYTFVKNGSDQWVNESYFKSSDGDTDDKFGSSISLNADGTLLVVGAPAEDSLNVSVNGNDADNSSEEAGAAYAFRKTAASWAFITYIKASNTDAGDLFGSSLMLDASGNSLLIGAPMEQSKYTGLDARQVDNSFAEAGGAYLY